MVSVLCRGQPLVSVLLGTELPLVLGLLYCRRGGGAAVLWAWLRPASLQRYLELGNYGTMAHRGSAKAPPGALAASTRRLVVGVEAFASR